MKTTDRNCGVLAMAFLLTAIAFMQPKAIAAGTPPPPQLMGGGAKIFINFADQQQSRLILVGALPAIPGLDLNGLNVGVSLGGVQRSYTLSPEGQGVGTPDLFQIRAGDVGLNFIVSTLDNSLAAAYQQFGLTNSNAINAPVSVPASITINGTTYAANLGGSYYGMMNSQGRAFLGVVRTPPDPFKSIMPISTLAASPNPTQANQLVTIKGSLSLKDFSGATTGDLHFGDMSPPIHADGATFQKMLKAGITHTYTADGVYVARVTLIGGIEVADTRLFVVVGSGFVVNSQSGAVGRLVKTGSGGVTLQVGLGNVPGGQTAQTLFKDKNGNTAGVPPGGPPPQGGQLGLAPSNNFTLPGLYVAEAQALDQAGNPLGTLRHTIPIGLGDIGTSAGARSARTSGTDNAITVTSMSGKFTFTSSKADTVVFNGTISLPAGYTPKDSSGNDISISVGNVIDTVHLTSKGKLTLPTSLGRITKFKLTPPKLTGGVAVGGETAKVSMTMSVADLDTTGFNTEGISSDVRSDESGQTSVARFIQVDMLVGGETYSGLVQVSYAVTTSGDFGSMSARSSK